MVVSRVRLVSSPNKTASIGKKLDSTNKKTTPPRRVLSFQQRKQLEKERQEKLAVLKSKIVTRKLAYIWLRKYFYPRSGGKRPSQTREGPMFLLPSQIK